MAGGGAWLLPGTVLLRRRIADAKRAMTAGWTGQRSPTAYRPLTGKLRERIRTALREPGTSTDLRWTVADCFYGALAGRWRWRGGRRTGRGPRPPSGYRLLRGRRGPHQHGEARRLGPRHGPARPAEAGLRARVADEGRGGAGETRGSGLLGIRRPVTALDGRRVLSPR
ncbi:sensor domain-containing protein [Streptomyces sp. SLBN-31]|uniref:sensor domain-containing protein n=1 Tax=Streptomyces sp. SLBN-31 TaxID=2768444 RepID=UPI00114DF14C|nr:sensor domain-containing protein [Streptomyces sp. SLBN-31]